MPGYSASHALMACSISTRPLGEPASGLVKSLTCMGTAECSFGAVIYRRQQRVWTCAAITWRYPLGWRQGAWHGQIYCLLPVPSTSPVKPLDSPLVVHRLLLYGGAGAQVLSVGACVSRALRRLEDSSERPRSVGHVGCVLMPCAQLLRPGNLRRHRRHDHAGVIHSPTDWGTTPNAAATRIAAVGESVARAG